MERELIVQALKSACGNKNLKFQIIIQHEQLHIYVNHRPSYLPNYSLLTENIGAAIANLALEDLDGVWLYSRPLGKVDPDWQTFISLTTVADDSDNNTVGSTEDLELDLDDFDFEFPTDSSTGNTGLLDETGMIHKNILKEEEITSFISASTDEFNSTSDKQNLVEADFPEFENFDKDESDGDGGLPTATGFVHGTYLEIDALQTGLTTTKLGKPKGSTIKDSEADNSDTNYHHLSQYCFVANQELLTQEIDPPDKEIMRLVKFFHHLDNTQHQKLLPILNSFFRRGEIFDWEKQSAAVQKWLKQINQLDLDKQRTAAIWLSRYCANSSRTLEEFKATIAKNDAEAKSKQALNRATTNSSTEYSFTPANKKHANTSNGEKLEPSKPKLKLPPKIKQLLLPAAWILITIGLITLGIVSNGFNSVVGNQQASAVCNSSLGSLEYCRLAVNLAGDKTIAKASKSLFSLTEVTQTVANYGCQRYANLKAGIPIDQIAPEVTPVISSSGEKILPQIYVIEVQQKNWQKLGNTRVGCVYTTGKGQRSPRKLAADVIPVNWPTQLYQQPAANGLIFGKYTKPIDLGLYTIFAAWGIALARWLHLGIKINYATTVYLVALILGITQLIANSIAFLGLLASFALPVTAILITSIAIEDFQLKWNQGYPLVALGVFMIIAIQFLSYGICLELIGSLV